MTNYIAASLFGFLMVAAASGDVLTLRIPNWLTVLIAVLFVPAAMVAGMSWPAIGLHLLAGFLLLIAGFGLFSAGIFGGGDAKLLAAAATWIGWPAMLPFLFWTSLSGGVLALLVLAWRSARKRSPEAPSSWRQAAVPYGVALAAGAILALPDSWWLSAAN